MCVSVYVYTHAGLCVCLCLYLNWVIPKTFKMVLDTSLLNTQQYKVRIKGKVEQSRDRSSTLLLHLGVVAIEKGAFWLPTLLT